MSTFAIVSDPHVAIPNPETGWTPPPMPHEPTMYAQSVELVTAAIEEINADPTIDFVVVLGDLTKDSEPYNHSRAREIFSGFRKPVFCISGNHDQPRPPRLRPANLLDPDVAPVRTPEIPRLYGDFGFDRTDRIAYSRNPTADIHLVGICSAKPDDDRGYIAPEILAWLDDDLTRNAGSGREPIVMLHHSIIEHVPGERVNPHFSWFHVENVDDLKAVLRKHAVRISLTGHLHIQDVKRENGLYNVVTSSLAGYPHAYRVVTLHDGTLSIRSRRLKAIPSIPDLQAYSRRFTGDAFVGILTDVMGAAPFNYTREQAETRAEALRDWWPNIADGDERFAYTEEQVGDPMLASYVNGFSDSDPPDNDLAIELKARS